MTDREMVDELRAMAGVMEAGSARDLLYAAADRIGRDGYVDDEEPAAAAARADEDGPRVLTLDELLDLPMGAVVYEEYIGDEDYAPGVIKMISDGDGVLYGKNDMTDVAHLWGQGWRWWTGMPTRAQRARTLWNEKEEGAAAGADE